ncbi:hypothetical protein I3843_Q066400 [Carya illinoinensis]|nr:hypothetical protein I3843_Q066400 [Carya illinoinensis]
MECLGLGGARNLAAMTVTFFPFGGLLELCGAAARTGSESCVAVDFDADEEDYVKAGGSEVLFVQMQQNKPMEMQSKLSDKLPAISVAENVLDLVVIGCGPAGLALAAESAKLGLKVGLIGPDLPFTNNYGVWEDEFKDLGLEGCIGACLARIPSYILDDHDPVLIGRAYGRVSRHLLHEEYEVGGPKVSVQTAYGVEVEKQNIQHSYMPCPMSPTRVFFEETCLASKNAMPLTMGIQITKTYEEEWSYIPVGGSLPNTEQKKPAFGAAASMVHPATGYSVVRSLSEAPNYASVIAKILKQSHSKDALTNEQLNANISMQAWNSLWPQERKRQRAFFLFGLALILQLDIEGIRTFFRTFFRLPSWMWQGFLGSTLSSADLVLFAFYMFVIAPNDLRKCLIRHLLSDPTGAIMIRTYLTI